MPVVSEDMQTVLWFAITTAVKRDHDMMYSGTHTGFFFFT